MFDLKELKIVLIGSPGSGKHTVAKYLATHLIANKVLSIGTVDDVLDTNTNTLTLTAMTQMLADYDIVISTRPFAVPDDPCTPHPWDMVVRVSASERLGIDAGVYADSYLDLCDITIYNDKSLDVMVHNAKMLTGYIHTNIHN